MLRLRLALAALFAAVLISLTPGCTTVEETGRTQFNFIPLETEIEMGIEAYRQALEKAPVSNDKALKDLVRRVGMRIAEASGRSDFQWEFTVIQDDGTVNAWALPGGKVAVYTGILKVTQDEAGLATVLGHEVAHASRHGGERISQNLALAVALEGGATALHVALQNREPETVDNVMKAFGVGAQVGILLPFNRKQELEADEVGLLYMARAGYEPEQAIEFWKRMHALSDASAQPPAFLSTHPSHEQRIQRLRALLPKAKAEYRPIPPAAGAAVR